MFNMLSQRPSSSVSSNKTPTPPTRGARSSSPSCLTAMHLAQGYIQNTGEKLLSYRADGRTSVAGENG